MYSFLFYSIINEIVFLVSFSYFIVSVQEHTEFYILILSATLLNLLVLTVCVCVCYLQSFLHIRSYSTYKVIFLIFITEYDVSPAWGFHKWVRGALELCSHPDLRILVFLTDGLLCPIHFSSFKLQPQKIKPYLQFQRHSASSSRMNTK